MSAEAFVQVRDGESALSPPATGNALVSRSKGSIIVLGGRFVTVAALAALLLGVAHHSHAAPARLGAIAIVALVFFACVQHAFVVTHFVLGPVMAPAAGAIVGLVATSALAFWFPVLRIDLLALVEIAMGLALLLPVIEGFLRQNVLRKRRVFFIGSSDAAASLRDELARLRGEPFEIVDAIDDGPGVGEAIAARRPDIVVLASEAPQADWVASLLDLGSAGRPFKVVGLTHFFEHALGRAPSRRLASSWFLSLLHLRQRSYSKASKRLFDVLIALAGLLITAPIWPVVAVLVRQSRGGLIFRQARVGEGGKEYTMYKFRTMRSDAEGPGGAVWAEVSDPRVAFAGRFLRETHLDELPQLWNVLRGDMSIVGPRPERPELLPMLEDQIPHWTRRLLVKPGITGWAQVCQGYASDCGGAEEKLSYDLWYVRHQSMLLDMAICLRTFSVVLSRAGAR